MRHQVHMRAAGTHYGLTRIYGTAGHAIGGTAQQALRRSVAHPPLLSSPGSATISGDYGPDGAAGVWTSPPPPLARGPDGIKERVLAQRIRKNLLRAGRSSWRTGAVRRPAPGSIPRKIARPFGGGATQAVRAVVRIPSTHAATRSSPQQLRYQAQLVAAKSLRAGD
jgi:hypothetical protein